MQKKSWALALALALASTTIAESRPRIYFPRHVKRQFTNSLETRDDIFPPATPTPNSGENGQNGRNKDGQDDSQLLDGKKKDDLVDDLLNGSNKDKTSDQNDLPTKSKDDDVLTINIPNTVVVQSTGAPADDANDEKGSQGDKTNPNALTDPTPPPSADSEDNTDLAGKSSGSSAESPAESSTEPSTESSTGTPNSKDDDKGAIVIAPTGLLSDDDSKDASKKSQNDTTIDLGLGKGNGQDATDDAANDNVPADEVPTDEVPTDEVPTDGLGQGKGNGQDTTNEPPTTDKPTEEEDDSGILGGILGGILDPEQNSTKTPDTTPPAGDETDTQDSQQSSTTPDDTAGSDLPPTDTDGELPAPVITPPPDTAPLEPVEDPLSSILSDVGDVIDIPPPPVVNNTDPNGSGTGDDDGAITLPGTVPTDVPGSEDPNGTVQPGGDATDTPPIPIPEETEGPTVPVPVPTDDDQQPGETGGQSTPPVETGAPTEPGTTANPTLVPGTGDGDGGDDGTLIEPTSTPAGSGTNTEPTGAPLNAAPNAGEPASTVTSIAVLSTVTGTTAWLGTELAADKTASAGAQVQAPAPTQGAETLPAGMPKTIEATEEDNPVQPEGTTLIRIVFDRRLHYEFVADNFTAAQQILTFLPQIIAFGENIDASQIQMMRLAPVSSNNKDWFPTGAYLYVPASIISPLSADIHLPNSLLYHPDHPVSLQLAAAIDPSFGIIPGSENGGQGAEKDPGGAPFTNSEDKPEEQSPQQQGATAGIAMGAVTVAVAYGAAMFIVARRYKRKKQAHRRASSITNTSDMRYSPSGSPAMMGGALLSREFSGYGGVAGGRESHGSGRSGAGNSGRTAYISAPVAAENSLGWN